MPPLTNISDRNNFYTGNKGCDERRLGPVRRWRHIVNLWGTMSLGSYLTSASIEFNLRHGRYDRFL
jgi:hypothetical protein